MPHGPLMPGEGPKILLVLFLSFLFGLEREEHKAGAEAYSFGGVRTFPLVGLLGYILALIAGSQYLFPAVGFVVIAAFLVVSYRHKIAASQTSGFTTEFSALLTYLLGALVSYEHFWIAVSIAVAGILLLELKITLEGLTKIIPAEEILTFAKFLLLTAVILPVVPQQAFGRFQINPFKTWLVVVAVSTISYASYVLLKVTRGKSGIMLSALLGGAYSSTATTVALAKRAAQMEQPHLFSGAILVASGIMYLRLAVLVVLFNRDLFKMLILPFAVLSAAALLAGWIWSRMTDADQQQIERHYQPGNPLELRAALVFAALYIVITIITRLAIRYAGHAGVYGLAGISGAAPDAFILSIIQAAGTGTSLTLAAIGILITSSSNNVVKAFYAWKFADSATGRPSLWMLLALAAGGLVPILWLRG